VPALSAQDHARVSEAVGTAEAGTSGEIVTVIAERSDGYSDIALAWSALVAFTVLTLLALFPQAVLGPVAAIAGHWNAAWLPWELFTIASCMGIAAFLAAWLVQLWRPLRMALVPGVVKTDRAENRAIDLFKVGADRRTQGRTGVLIYLSLAEHRAEIVADEAITAKVAPEVWGVAMADMLVEIREGRLADGLVAGVRDVGAILAEHFPRSADDVNELPDRLIEL
jgi:putative membrane protein